MIFCASDLIFGVCMCETLYFHGLSLGLRFSLSRNHSRNYSISFSSKLQGKMYCFVSFEMVFLWLQTIEIRIHETVHLQSNCRTRTLFLSMLRFAGRYRIVFLQSCQFQLTWHTNHWKKLEIFFFMSFDCEYETKLLYGGHRLYVWVHIMLHNNGILFSHTFSFRMLCRCWKVFHTILME